MDEYIVKKVTKKGKKYLVEISNIEEELVLSEDLIVEYRIIAGTIFDKKTLKMS